MSTKKNGFWSSTSLVAGMKPGLV